MIACDRLVEIIDPDRRGELHGSTTGDEGIIKRRRLRPRHSPAQTAVFVFSLSRMMPEICVSNNRVRTIRE
jgi:hypothetical protein